MNWIFLFYVLSLFTYCEMFKRTQHSLDYWLSNSYLTIRNKDFIFILNVVILSFKSLRFILLFRVRSLLEAMFFPILNLHVSVVINFEILLLKFWLKFKASQSAPCSLSLYISTPPVINAPKLSNIRTLFCKNLMARLDHSLWLKIACHFIHLKN